MNSRYSTTIEESKGFQKWKKKRSKYYFQNAVMILGITVLIGAGLFFAGMDQMKAKEIIFAMLFLSFFLGVGLGQAKKWRMTKDLEISEY